MKFTGMDDVTPSRVAGAEDEFEYTAMIILPVPPLWQIDRLCIVPASVKVTGIARR
jgi:hypothetical protein